MVTTPQSIAPHIVEFCAAINPNAKPGYVSVFPARHALAGEAFHNVQHHIERTGSGLPCNGWIIWEWPGLFVEAEHHCVYNPANGESMRDITPQDERRVLFLPDETATYDFESDSRARPNRRKAVRNHRLVHDYLAAFQMRDDFIQEKLKLGAKIEETLSTRDMARFVTIVEEIDRLTFELLGLQ